MKNTKQEYLRELFYYYLDHNDDPNLELAFQDLNKEIESLSLDFKTSSVIDEKIIYLYTLALEIGFYEGFNVAAKLMK